MFLSVTGVRMLSWKFCHPGASLGWPTNAWVECSVALDSLCLTVAVGYPHSNAFSSHITKKVYGSFLVICATGPTSFCDQHRACQNGRVRCRWKGLAQGAAKLLAQFQAGRCE